MVSFKTKQINSLSLGEMMKKAREEKGVSLKDVSEETKVQMKYLELIESGDYEKLPADVYTKGFLKHYGEYLGLDIDKLILLYNKEKNIVLNIKNKGQKIVVEPIKESSFVITPKVVLVTFLMIVIVGVLIYLWCQVGTLLNPPLLEIYSPVADSIVNSSGIVVSGFTNEYTEVILNGRIIEVNDEGEFSEEYTLEKGLNIIEVKAINKLKKETIITRKIIKE